MSSQPLDLLNNRFSCQQRLLKPAQFKAVFDRNITRAGNAAFLLLALPNNGHYSRLGLVVGKKALKSAVARNAVKRIVREQFRHHRFSCPIDLIFLAKPGINAVEAALLAGELRRQFARLDKRLVELMK